MSTAVTSSRNAFTLIELMAAIALSALVVGVAYSALHATSEVIAATRSMAMSNALLRSAVLRSYRIADGLDPAVTFNTPVTLGSPLDSSEFDLVPDEWPRLTLDVDSGDRHHAPMLFLYYLAPDNYRPSAAAAPYGWVDAAGSLRNGRLQIDDVVHPAYSKHNFHITMSDPLTSQSIHLPFAVAGAVGGP